MAGGPFKKGFDPRRNLRGRPPSGLATRELALEMAQIMDQEGKDEHGKKRIISRKQAILEALFQSALVEKDKGDRRYLANLLFNNDHGFTPTPEGETPTEMLDPEIEELLQGLIHDADASAQTVRASPRSRKKAGTGKKTTTKARQRGPILSPRVPAKPKGRR